MNLYPDDHRCSDQETDGGLCGCMMVQSGSEEEEDFHQPVAQRRDEDNSYTRRLFLARNRKILQQQSVHTRTSSLDDHASVSTAQPGQRDELPTRSVASDPIDKTMDDDELLDAFPLSSPSQRTRYSPSKSLRASTSTLNGAQSAARKSISNVYERLLREEEERRESERVRKEQARQRRRVERLRKQEDSEMLARLISSSSSQSNAKEIIENGDEMQMPPYTSPILAVSPPSTRDVSLDLRTNLLQNEDGDIDEMAANGHLHPAHAFTRSTNAARLAAVRAANMIEETRDNENVTPSITIPSLGLAPPFAQDGKLNGSAFKSEEHYHSSPLNASPASSADSVLSWTFPNRTSPTASPQLLSPNLNTFSPQNSNQSSSSPRRNRHRRGTHGEGGASQVLSLSARVPSLNAAKTAAKVKKELYSPDPDLPDSPGHFSVAQEEEEEALKSHDEIPAPATHGKRRVSFSPKPEFITTFTPVAEESEEEEEESYDNNAEDSIPTIRIPDEIVEEVTEGSENSRVTDVPLQSTPPRKKRNSGSDRSNSTTVAPKFSPIGDDSLRLTLEQLNKFLKDREEKKDIISLPPDDTIKSEPEKASIVHLSITELTDSSKDEEYVRQLDEARERLNRIARSYTGVSKPVKSFQGISTVKIGVCLIGICILQFGLAFLMNAAAQAKAEEMYLTMHYNYLGGIEEVLLFEAQSKSSLFVPLFSQWGILPDLGRLAIGDRDQLLNDWISTFRWILKTGWQYRTIWQAIRLSFAKLAYSLGLYGINTAPIGGMIPS